MKILFVINNYIFPIFQPIIRSSGFSYADGDMKVIEEAVRWADVVHLEEMFVLQWKAIKIAQKLGKPITATFHMFPENLIYSLGIGPLRNWKWINQTLLKAWRKHIYNHCDFVQCPTETVLDRLRRYHFKAKLGVISNGLIQEACTRPETPPENYLDPNRPFNILYIGRLSHEKDQPTLMEAMRYRNASSSTLPETVPRASDTRKKRPKCTRKAFLAMNQTSASITMTNCANWPPRPTCVRTAPPSR